MGISGGFGRHGNSRRGSRGPSTSLMQRSTRWGPTRGPAGGEGEVEEPFQFMVPARRRRSKSVPS
jgi:hypothetical protein